MKRFLATMLMCLLSVSFVNADAFSDNFDSYADTAAFNAAGWNLVTRGVGANYWNYTVDSGFVISTAVGDSTWSNYDAEYMIQHDVNVTGDFSAEVVMGWDITPDDQNPGQYLNMGAMGMGLAVGNATDYYAALALGHWMGTNGIDELQVNIGKSYPDDAWQVGYDFGGPYDPDGGTISASGVVLGISRTGSTFSFKVNGGEVFTRTNSTDAVTKLSLYAVTYDWGDTWNDSHLGPQFADSISITPEPTLMGLLAAGALWLRRRVK